MLSAETQIASEMNRQELAKQQAALIDVLKCGGPLPPGFCHRQTAIAARALAIKRAAGIRKAAPWLAEGLGDSFPSHLAEFTQGHPAPPKDGPPADALAFARWLQDRALLPDSCLLQMQVAAVSWRRPLKVVCLPGRRKLAVIVKSPALGVRVFTLPPRWKSKAAPSQAGDGSP